MCPFGQRLIAFNCYDLKEGMHSNSYWEIRKVEESSSSLSPICAFCCAHVNGHRIRSQGNDSGIINSALVPMQNLLFFVQFTLRWHWRGSLQRFGLQDTCPHVKFPSSRLIARGLDFSGAHNRGGAIQTCCFTSSASMIHHLARRCLQNLQLKYNSSSRTCLKAMKNWKCQV